MHEKKFGHIFKNWKFFSFDWSSIDRITIESGRKSWLKIKGFSISRKTYSIDWNSGKLDFLKNYRSLCRKYSNQKISLMECMRMSLKVFENMIFQPRTSKQGF